MTVSDRWLLPDGVEDILPPVAARIEKLRRAALDTYARWGYQQIIPPLIEYLESLLTGTGTDLALQTFKLTDQLSGRLMGVRADMTPQAARIDAHGWQQTGVSRLCYAGHVLHTRPASPLTGRTPFQVGCELFGSDALAADFEVIALMLETLRLADVDRVHLDLAHVGICRNLLQAADIQGDVAEQVFDALRRKSIPELDQLLGAHAADSPAGMLRSLARISGGLEGLAEARQCLIRAPLAVQQALDAMVWIAGRLQRDYPALEIGFDFCELRGYNYHTGLVFAAYTPGMGQAIAQGGRYDAVGAAFGKARPATGFSADLRLLAARQTVTTPGDAIWAPALEDAALEGVVAGLRATQRVIRALPGETRTPRDCGCDRQLVLREGQWVLEPLS